MASAPSRGTEQVMTPHGRFIAALERRPLTGLPLERYEMMLDTWRTEGIS
jgi:hypothetical protein